MEGKCEVNVAECKFAEIEDEMDRRKHFDYFQYIAKWLRVMANISNNIEAREITERYFWCGRKRGSVFTFSGLKHVAKQNES